MVVITLLVRRLLVPGGNDALQSATRDLWSAAAAGAAVLAVVPFRGNLATALAPAPPATLPVALAVWLRYLTNGADAAGVVRIHVMNPLAMLAPAILLTALATLAHRTTRTSLPLVRVPCAGGRRPGRSSGPTPSGRSPGSRAAGRRPAPER
ncbi:hypothetical protein ACWT_5519 [Actinoplanes sp. SE50]|nr:hypothetical protein ACPL_5649 [Actinoplanes sp. SE50/110]ATO84934.1 hypothetical protein ACWT_5519 [Actinoplanes sp. SE50]SLM02343.1 hypothetical protein ACSP50_5582 [Actinoplanes sp. SE50/110]